MCYLDTNDKITCSGCESCANICPHKAIYMIPDSEEFRYPKINIDLCTNCGLCRKVCPYNLSPQKCSGINYTFGGHIKNQKVLSESTSGGAFSAIVCGWIDRVHTNGFYCVQSVCRRTDRGADSVIDRCDTDLLACTQFPQYCFRGQR